MGVMGCSRYRCTNIMCHTYIYDIGYICHECKEEFKVYLIKRNKNPDSMRDADIKRHLSTFMQTDNDSFTKGNVSSVDDFFDSYSND